MPLRIMKEIKKFFCFLKKFYKAKMGRSEFLYIRKMISPFVDKVNIPRIYDVFELGITKVFEENVSIKSKLVK